MDVKSHTCVEEFWEQCGKSLLANRVEHNLMLGLCERAYLSHEAGEELDVRFVSVWDNGKFEIAGLQTPPHNFVLSLGNEEAIEPLVKHLKDESWEFPGVVSNFDLSEAFAKSWSDLVRTNFSLATGQKIYSLKKVKWPKDVKGRGRKASMGEQEMVAEWLYKFSQEALHDFEQRPREHYLETVGVRIEKGSFYLWCSENGNPVSMCAAHPNRFGFSRINAVYTPKEYRGHGHGSSVVAYASQDQLDNDHKLCCLYTDASNEVANSIYQNVGFDFVCDSANYVFGNR